MTSEINQLFEEGITRAGELTDAADEAMNAIDGMVKAAEGMTGRVRDEGREACRHLRDVVARLEQAEGELEATRVKAEGGLEGLAGAAAGLEAEVGGLLERVTRSMDDLQEQKGRLDGSVDGQVSSTEADFTRLAERTQELEAETSRHLEEAGAALCAFRAALDGARADFSQKRQGWAAALESVETHAREQAATWTAGLLALLLRQTAAMVDVANTTVDRHNGTMRRLKQRFVEQVPQELASAIAPVRAAAEGLKESAATRQQGLSARAQQLGQAAVDALAFIDVIQAGLASTGRLG